MTPLDKAYSEWLALQPLDAQTQYKISQRFTIDFNYNSNHIEGNTLTYGQTELLLLFGKVMGEAEMKDFEEMKASDVGLKMMEMEASAHDKPLTQNFIRQLHKTLLREDYTVYRPLPDGGYTSYIVHAGQYKTRPNSVLNRSGERFEYASPEETPALMTDLIDWYNKAEQNGEMTPVELAALFHYRYIRIHPFEDGNGRIARLLVNYILTRHNYPMIVVRSRKKKDYLEALSASDKVVGSLPAKGASATLREIRHFLDYFTKLVTDEIIAQVKFATVHDENIWWYDGQMVRFRTPTTGEILSAMMMNAGITTKEISNRVGVNVAAVNKHLKKLTAMHYIYRKENGDWHVVIYPSV
ncbi:MAG: Fic family protein [Prevotellaceae bacterium]|nr:Fic family protein [Prevotellaceae bacterium]